MCLAAKVPVIVRRRHSARPGHQARQGRRGEGDLPPPALALAKKLVRSGADALVIEGSEAGGHIGPVSLNVLAQEILPHIKDVPVFVAGGIGRGEAILSLFEMGRSACSSALACLRHGMRGPSELQEGLPCALPRGTRCRRSSSTRASRSSRRALANAGTQRFMEHQAVVIDRFRKGRTDQGRSPA